MNPIGAANSKLLAFGTLALASLVLYIVTHLNSGFTRDISGTQSKPIERLQELKEPLPNLVLSQLFVTPVDSSLPSSFFAEIENTGHESAKGFSLIVDFGEATADACELPGVKPMNKSDYSGPIVRIEELDLSRNESIYLVCTSNQPFFKKVVISGGNLPEEKTLTYKAYREDRFEGDRLFWNRLVRWSVTAVLSALLLTLCAFLTRLILR